MFASAFLHLANTKKTTALVADASVAFGASLSLVSGSDEQTMMTAALAPPVPG